MRLIRHLAWHDLRAQRLPLAVLCLALLTEAALVTSGYVPRGRIGNGPIIALTRLLLTSFVAALIVQRDPLVGTTAFWRTRPIGRASLLSSKGLAIGLTLVIAPSAIAFATWRQTGLYVTDAAAVAGVVAVEQATVVLLTTMAAVVTPSLTHLVVAGVAGATLVTALNSILLRALLTTWPFIGQTAGAHPATYLGTLFVFGVPTIAYHYLTLREWRTAALVGVTLLAATGITRLWPGDEIQASFPPVDRAILDPTRVRVALYPETIVSADWATRIGAAAVRGRQYSVEGEIDGFPSGLFLLLQTTSSRLLLSDTTVPFTATGGGNLTRPADRASTDSFRMSMQAALGVARLPDYPALSQRRGRLLLMGLPSDVDRHHAGQRGVLTTNLTLQAFRFRVAGTASLRPGARLAATGEVYRIDDVTPGQGDLARIRAYRIRDHRRSFYARRLALRNLVTREAFLLEERQARHPMNATVSILRMSATWSAGFLRPLPDPREAPAKPMDAAWLANAELVLLETENVGVFTRPAQIELVVGGTEKR